MWMVSGKLPNNQWGLEMLVQRGYSPAGASMCVCVGVFAMQNL